MNTVIRKCKSVEVHDSHQLFVVSERITSTIWATCVLHLPSICHWCRPSARRFPVYLLLSSGFLSTPPIHTCSKLALAFSAIHLTQEQYWLHVLLSDMHFCSWCVLKRQNCPLVAFPFKMWPLFSYIHATFSLLLYGGLSKAEFSPFMCSDCVLRRKVS